MVELTDCQIGRFLRGVEGAGDRGLVHRGGEKPSNRCITEPTKAKMLHLSEACCGDLALTVAADKLAARDGLDVNA